MSSRPSHSPIADSCRSNINTLPSIRCKPQFTLRLWVNWWQLGESIISVGDIAIGDYTNRIKRNIIQNTAWIQIGL